MQTVDVESLAYVRQGESPVFGDFLKVSDPVFAVSADVDAKATKASSAAKFIGYVSVGVSPLFEQIQVARANAMATGIGCVLVLISLPLAYILVRSDFPADSAACGSDQSDRQR